MVVHLLRRRRYHLLLECANLLLHARVDLLAFPVVIIGARIVWGRVQSDVCRARPS
jgi:hypothetical protein